MRTFVVLGVGVLLYCCALTFGEDAPKKETPISVDALESLIRKASDPKLTKAGREALLRSVVGRAVRVKVAVEDANLSKGGSKGKDLALITGKCMSKETVTVKIPAQPGLGGPLPATTQKWFKYSLSVGAQGEGHWAEGLNKGDWVAITGVITDLTGGLSGPDPSYKGASPSKPMAVIGLQMSIAGLAKTTGP